MSTKTNIEQAREELKKARAARRRFPDSVRLWDWEHEARKELDALLDEERAKPDSPYYGFPRIRRADGTWTVPRPA